MPWPWSPTQRPFYVWVKAQREQFDLIMKQNTDLLTAMAKNGGGGSGGSGGGGGDRGGGGGGGGGSGGRGG